MPNVALARAFEEIGDYLELAGDNPFKIRAYRRAADAVLDFPGALEDASNEELENIEGLGAATVAKTREWAATGTIRLLEHLRRENPPGLLEVLRVPGLGPKKVKLLYTEKGIDSLEKFAAALDNGDLKGVSGFGPKTIENLKIGLRRMAELSERMPLTHARVLAERLKRAFAEKLPAVELYDAGSLRRGLDTLGNLNFVARAGDAAPILDAFAGLAYIAEVVERDETRLQARALNGMEIELVVAPAAEFGSVLWFAKPAVTPTLGARSRVKGRISLTKPNFTRRPKRNSSRPNCAKIRGEWQAARAGNFAQIN